ncbi:MAG: hypothetical protein ACUVXG_14820 [Anaerolineae bacterium]
MTNVSLAGVLDEDYVRTARSKGFPPFTLMCRHAYRNVRHPRPHHRRPLRFSLISLPVMELERFLEARRGFKGAYDIKAVIFIRGVASPDGNRLLISTGGSMRLANLFEQAARRMGVGTRRVDEQVDLSRMLQASTRSGRLSPGAMGMGTGQKAPTIVLEWEGGRCSLLPVARYPRPTQ